jgi:hypothetical protein
MNIVRHTNNLDRFVLDQDLVQIPLVTVVIGCVASILLVIAILVVLSNPNHSMSNETCSCVVFVNE